MKKRKRFTIPYSKKPVAQLVRARHYQAINSESKLLFQMACEEGRVRFWPSFGTTSAGSLHIFRATGTMGVTKP